MHHQSRGEPSSRDLTSGHTGYKHPAKIPRMRQRHSAKNTLVGLINFQKDWRACPGMASANTLLHRFWLRGFNDTLHARQSWLWTMSCKAVRPVVIGNYGDHRVVIPNRMWVAYQYGHCLTRHRPQFSGPPGLRRSGSSRYGFLSIPLRPAVFYNTSRFAPGATKTKWPWPAYRRPVFDVPEGSRLQIRLIFVESFFLSS